MSTSIKPCLAAAIEYLKLGWSVLPLCPHDHAGVPGAHETECTAPGKLPLWPWKQYQERRAPESQLRVLWNRVPASNVGIIIGPVSGLIGIDVDGAEGIRLLTELADGRIITPTLQFNTPGGGLRYLYQWPQDQASAIQSIQRNGKEAVRLLGEGSQTVAPPSIHRSGQPYTWRQWHDPENMKVALCPAWLLAELINFEHPLKPARTICRPLLPSVSPLSPDNELRSKIESAVLPPAKLLDAFASRFKDIVRKDIDWLWRHWLALGKLAVLDGDPGLGKSTLLLDLAARVSNAGVMPDNSQGVAGNVIIMSAEDSAADTIKPRLEAAGANLDRIINLSHVIIKGEEQPIEIPSHLPLIAGTIKQHDARLLIIDPLLAFLCGADANKDQEVRRVLYKLSKIAENCHCAIICMRHLNKGAGQKAIYRGNCSIGVIGHARTGLLVAEDPDDRHRRILAMSKCNLGPRPQSLRFVLDPMGEVCRIAWRGLSPYQADRLVQAPKNQEKIDTQDASRTKVEQAVEILQMLLEKSNGKVEVTTAKHELLSADIAKSTYYKALQKLKIKTHWDLDAKGERIYFWAAETPVESRK